MLVIDVLIQNKLDEIKKLKEEAKLKGYKYIEKDDRNWAKISRIITCWYEFKYPKDIIKNNTYDDMRIVAKLSKFNIEKLEQLSKYMSYSELMNRIPNELYYLIECWYRDKEGKISDYISGNIYKKNTNIKSEIPFTIYNRDGYFEKLDSSFDGTLIKQNCPYIEYFAAIINKETYDITEMQNIIDMHNTDLELRRLNLEYVALKLLKSDKDILTGYIRAKSFINDFNLGTYGLNLKKEVLPNLDYLNLNHYKEMINNFIKRSDSESKIDTFGLSIETVQFLKNQDINNLNQLYNENLYTIIYGDGIINFKIGKKDMRILNDLMKLADINYDNYIKNILEMANKSNVKTKKKSIFNKKNKQK